MINIDYSCSRCGVSYVLFKKDVLCPNCKKGNRLESHEHFKFIPTTVKNMRLNKRKYGKYSRDGEKIESLVDQIQKVCFNVFDNIENIRPDNPEEYIKYLTNKIHWHGTPYLKIHTREILTDLYDAYRKNPPHHSLFSKTKFLFS